jgi:hypothetical protein
MNRINDRRDVALNHVNDGLPGSSAAPCPDNCAECGGDQRLRVLAEKLEMRGLDSRLVSHPVEGVKGRHHDALSVTNAAAPERGMIHVEKDGSVTWVYSGELDDAGISKILDEATNALRASGLRRWKM